MTSNRSIVERYLRAFNARDFDAWSELLDENVEITVDARLLRGVEAARDFAAGVVRAYPGLRAEVERVVAESGDTIVVEYRLVNPAADGSDAAWHLGDSACEIFHLRDGRIVAFRSHYVPPKADRTEVVNVPSRADAARIAEEQAALRRLATLVARGVPPSELFGAVTEEVGRLLDGDLAGMIRFEPDDTVVAVATWAAIGEHVDVPGKWALEGDRLATGISRSGLPTREDAWGDVGGPIAALVRDGLGVRSSVGSPIVVESRVWGALFVHTTRAEPLPADTEPRLGHFTALVATAMANVEARAEAERLAEEQAALRRVATLVARQPSPDEVFAAVAEELGLLLRVEETRMLRFEGDGSGTFVATWSSSGRTIGVGTRLSLEGENVPGLVLRTGRPARVDDYSDADGEFAAFVREQGTRAAAGSPIVVEGRLWGVMVAASLRPEPLPTGTESRISQFTELVATAMANVQARAEVERLADEQASLRRVAELVARGAAPGEVFATVAAEVGAVLRVQGAKVLRYEEDQIAHFVASWGPLQAGIPVGARIPFQGNSVTAQIFASHEPARLDDYGQGEGQLATFLRDQGMHSAVGCPIIVEGRLWGAMMVGSVDVDPLPPGTEERMLKFTELLATAISDIEARAELHRLAEEQASLRRVATLVARQPAPAEALTTVAREVGTHLGLGGSTILRYESDGTATVVAGWGDPDMKGYVGRRLPIEGDNPVATVWDTRRPARQEEWSKAQGTLAEMTREVGISWSVASPIVVEGQLWGAIVVVSLESASPPPGIEERMGKFTELVGTAIGNVKARSELTESRARIVRTGDETRRRFERDLHDGVQQRLVSLSLDLRGAKTMLPADLEAPRAQLSQVEQGLTDALDDLRELSRGLHPAVLSEGGLEPAIRALARRSPVPTKLELAVPNRLREPVEVAAYYVVSEALANAAKHAKAAVAEVHVEARDGVLGLTIKDDGIGGADPAGGSGLVGLTDRVEALGGTIAITSPPGKGTRLRAELPVEGA